MLTLFLESWSCKALTQPGVAAQENEGAQIEIRAGEPTEAYRIEPIASPTTSALPGPATRTAR